MMKGWEKLPFVKRRSIESCLFLTLWNVGWTSWITVQPGSMSPHSTNSQCCLTSSLATLWRLLNVVAAIPPGRGRLLKDEINWINPVYQIALSVNRSVQQRDVYNSPENPSRTRWYLIRWHFRRLASHGQNICFTAGLCAGQICSCFFTG